MKGSGSDLATIKADQFTGLKLDEVLPLMERDSMSDEDMVSYLAACQLRPDMPRGSIETLLHAFVPYPHVNHTHPDAVNMICCSEGGENHARECYGEAVWIPYIWPGFTLSRQVGEAVRNNPQARFLLLAKHGLVTWGDTHEESYNRTIGAINRAAEYVAKRGGDQPFGGQGLEPLAPDEREALLAEVLPALREALSGGAPKILRPDTSEGVLGFDCGRDAELFQVGAACPDHLVRTKARPLWVDFDPKSEDADALVSKLHDRLEKYREDYEAYFGRHEEADEEMFDPSPRLVLIPGVGLVAAVANLKEADLSRDFYHRAITVMRGRTRSAVSSPSRRKSYTL